MLCLFRYTWQGIALLPFLNFDTLETELKPLDSQLAPEEGARTRYDLTSRYSVVYAVCMLGSSVLNVYWCMPSVCLRVYSVCSVLVTACHAIRRASSGWLVGWLVENTAVPVAVCAHCSPQLCQCLGLLYSILQLLSKTRN